MAQPCRSPPPQQVLEHLRNAFLMDFENDVLRSWDARKGIPRGPRRFENKEWAALVQQHVYPHHSDVTWEQYMTWVRGGGGDEWFQEEEESLFCAKHKNGPWDVWYDCDACVQEVRAEPMPQDGRYVWIRRPINGGQTGQAPADLRRLRPARGPGISIRREESGSANQRD